MGHRRQSALAFPAAQVDQDFFDDHLFLDKGDHPHRPRAARTQQRIDLIYFLDQSRPVAPKRVVRQLRFQDAFDLAILLGLAPFAA